MLKPGPRVPDQIASCLHLERIHLTSGRRVVRKIKTISCTPPSPFFSFSSQQDRFRSGFAPTEKRNKPRLWSGLFGLELLALKESCCHVIHAAFGPPTVSPTGLQCVFEYLKSNRDGQTKQKPKTLLLLLLLLVCRPVFLPSIDPLWRGVAA